MKILGVRKTLLSLKAAEDTSLRRLLLREMSRVIAQIDHDDHDAIALK